jgi:hypothetical protein
MSALHHIHYPNLKPKIQCLYKVEQRIGKMAISETERRKQQELIINYNLRFHLRALNLCGLGSPENISSDP